MLRRQVYALAQRRGFAAASPAPAGSTSSWFESTADVAGVKVASRDAHGPTTKLAVVVKAGTRYQPLPGLTVGLEEYAFKVRLPCKDFPSYELISVVDVEHTETLGPEDGSRVGAPRRAIERIPHARGSRYRD